MADRKQFDLQAFKAFVESKPEFQGYDSCDPQRCALAQFGEFDVTAENIADRNIPHAVYWVAVHTHPFTFGALSDRLNNLTAGKFPCPAEGGDTSPVVALNPSDDRSL